MERLQKMFKKYFKKMKKNEKNGSQRKIDQAVEKTTKSIDSQFSLISKREIKAWKAYLIVFFVAGFAAALIWAAYLSWYPMGKATTLAILRTHSAVGTHKQGDTFPIDIFLDTGGSNIVAVQAVLGFDATAIHITSIDTSASAFNNEVKNTYDNSAGTAFVAMAKPTPGVSSSSAKVATINVTALKDSNEPVFNLKFASTTDVVNNCAVIADDGQGTNVLSSVAYDFPAPPPSDTTPPVISNGSPTGTLTAGTTTSNLRVMTNESATCKYDTTSGKSYGSMGNTFSTTGGTTHTSSLSGLTNGTSYNYYVRCQDSAGNPDATDYKISFSVAAPTGGDSTPPVISSGSPTGILKVGTTSATLKVATNEAATCKYDTKANTVYDSMANKFTTDGSTNHSVKIGGLTNGTTYNYYVRCKDVSGNVNSSDYTVSFSVAPSSASSDKTAPKMSNPLPSGSLPNTTTSTTISVQTDESATCKYGSSLKNYNALPNTFSTTGGTTHSSTISVSSGNSYKYYVRCKDVAGNITSGFILIMFSVQ